MSEAALQVNMSGEVRRGDPSNSKLSIEIKNPTSTDVVYTFYMTIPAAFVAREHAEQIVFGGLPADMINTGENSNTKWLLGIGRGTSIPKNGAKTFTLSEIAAASAGVQTINMEWWQGQEQSGSRELKVSVLESEQPPRIHAFEAETYVLTWTGGDRPPINLRWQVDPGATVELWRQGTKIYSKPDDGGRLSEWYPDASYGHPGLQAYELKATANNKTVSRWVFVRVEEPGWNKVLCSQGSPTLLLNDHDNALYGVFVRDGQAAIYQLDPEKGALGRDDALLQKSDVPRGMEKSPGAFFKNKIWLVGGSQIDPSVCSNTVWCYDPANQSSDSFKADEWSPRMGHACVVFDDRLWILGGVVDVNGRPLGAQDPKDGPVWSWSGKKGEAWVKHTPQGWPETWGTAACFLSTAAFEKNLYIYAGADDPLGTPRTELLFSINGKDWKLQQFQGETSDLGLGIPYGSGLCVRSENRKPLLTIVGTYMEVKGPIVGPKAVMLKGKTLVEFAPIPQTKSWDTTTSREGMTYEQPFRLSAVGFKSWVFVAAILYRFNPESLTYYRGS